jgi:hypothetical protein
MLLRRRNLTLYFAPLVFLVLSAAGNNVSAFEFRYGAKGGIAVSSLHFESDETFLNEDRFESRSGFVGGTFIQLDLVNMIAARIELNYGQRGAKEGIIRTDESGSVIDTSYAKYQLDYIEIPILAQFYFDINGKISPRIFFGNQIGINVKSELTFPGFGAGSETTDDVETENPVFDFVVGAGADVPLGTFVLSPEFRYVVGLSDTGLFPSVTKLRTFEFSFGIAFLVD